jgi:hypothetical protein
LLKLFNMQNLFHKIRIFPAGKDGEGRLVGFIIF